MKRILSLCLILMLLATACAEAPGNRLGFDVLRLLAEDAEGENVVFSPVGLAMTLAMEAQGAKGATRDEILAALEVEEPADVAALIAPLEDAGLRTVNAALEWILDDEEPEGDRAGTWVRDDFRDALKERFDVHWFSVSQSDDPDALEDAMEEFSALLDEDDFLLEKNLTASPECFLWLLNSVSMDADWRFQFSANDTADELFHAPGGDVIVPMMHNELWADCGARDGVKLLRLEYADSALRLCLALPEEGGVPAVLEALSAEGLDYFRFDDEQTYVSLALPKVDATFDAAPLPPDADLFDFGQRLNQILCQLGIETAYSEARDFSGMFVDDGPGPMECDVDQYARLVLDEEGTEAAAITQAGFQVTMAAPPAEELRFDRPFVAVIVDEASGAVCFAAVIVDPSAVSD